VSIDALSTEIPIVDNMPHATSRAAGIVRHQPGRRRIDPVIVTASAWDLKALNGLVNDRFNHMGGMNTVHLAQAPMSPNKGSTPASFTEATYVGYAAGAIAGWTASYLNAAGLAETIWTAYISFAAPASGSAQTIYGYWLEDSNTNYVGAETFVTPWNAAVGGSPLNFIASFNLRAIQDLLQILG
jgi:hypothetical protein